MIDVTDDQPTFLVAVVARREQREVLMKFVQASGLPAQGLRIDPFTPRPNSPYAYFLLQPAAASHAESLLRGGADSRHQALSLGALGHCTVKAIRVRLLRADLFGKKTETMHENNMRC